MGKLFPVFFHNEKKCEEVLMAEAGSNPVSLADAVGYIDKLQDFTSQQQAVPQRQCTET